MSNVIPIALAGLGGYLAFGMVDSDVPAKHPQLPIGKPSKFAPLGKLAAPLVANVNKAQKASATAAGGGMPKNPFLFGSGGQKNGSAAKNTKQTSNAHGQQIDKAMEKYRKEYNKLSSDAKKKGAQKLNELLNPSPGLTGDESWESASKKIVASIGGATGGALCGPPCAALGAMAGAYLGKKLGKELGEQWKQIDKWVDKAAKSVADYAKDKVKDAGNKLKDLIGI